MAGFIEQWDTSEPITPDTILQLNPVLFERMRDIILYSGKIDDFDGNTNRSLLEQKLAKEDNLNSDSIVEARAKN